jgi:hypothetical protein
MRRPFPSIYANRPSRLPPVWSLLGGSHYVLQCADGVGGSGQLGSVGIGFTDTFHIATVTVPGTRDLPGALDVTVGRFSSLDQAKAAVEQAVALRQANPASFDKAARKAFRADELRCLEGAQ